MDDTLSPSSSCSSISTYDGDVLVNSEIPTPPKFNEKIVDFLKCICCNKRNN
jgi:hypothetical protein